MKQQILDILDKSTSSGMKAEEIMRLLKQRRQRVVSKWEMILSEDTRFGHDVLYPVADDMICPEEDL
jgi:hypothetical protein|uniref:Uncharacterized protein n=1 Tax=Podoviridae sp. ctdDI2 TaxID=2826567 RepID=A0A8S5NR58_9CAUD|nr:MAG TPA: hypothetical protein [Podoviridae sp. ctdDI2]